MLASSPSGTALAALTEGYTLCARAEGKSPKTIQIMTRSVAYFGAFLMAAGRPADIARLGPEDIRAYARYLQEKTCFSRHRYTHPQEHHLAPHTVNLYLRSLRAFWGWLRREDIVTESPFARVRVPPPPHKVVPTFSDDQIKALLDQIDTRTPEGFRDHTVILTLLDTAMRISELTGLKIEDLRLEDRTMKLFGKGARERVVPIGRGLQRLLWRYISWARPEPSLVKCTNLFLTQDGRPLTKNRVAAFIHKYAKRASISGMKSSPHVFRHTAAVSFLRNGGDTFSLQRLLGHASLEMTRHYCQIADVDLQKAHASASPVDNLINIPPSGQTRLGRIAVGGRNSRTSPERASPSRGAP